MAQLERHRGRILGVVACDHTWSTITFVPGDEAVTKYELVDVLWIQSQWGRLDDAGRSRFQGVPQEGSAREPLPSCASLLDKCLILPHDTSDVHSVFRHPFADVVLPGNVLCV